MRLLPSVHVTREKQETMTTAQHGRHGPLVATHRSATCPRDSAHFAMHNRAGAVRTACIHLFSASQYGARCVRRSGRSMHSTMSTAVLPVESCAGQTLREQSDQLARLPHRAGCRAEKAMCRWHAHYGCATRTVLVAAHLVHDADLSQHGGRGRVALHGSHDGYTCAICSYSVDFLLISSWQGA